MNPQTSPFPFFLQFSENPTNQGKVSGRQIFCVAFLSTAGAGEALKIVRVSVNLAPLPSGFHLGGGNRGFPAMCTVSVPICIKSR